MNAQTIFDAFFQQWNGKAPYRPGAKAGECVALYRCWLDALGLPQSPPVVGAKDIATTYLKNDFIPIQTSQLQVGDVIVFAATSYNPYGHVAIYSAPDRSCFWSFDANWREDHLAHIETHTFGGVILCLRPNILSMTLHDFLVDGLPADERIAALKDQVNRLQTTNVNLTKIINSPDDGIQALKNIIADRDKLLDSKRQQIIDLQAQVGQGSTVPVVSLESLRPDLEKHLADNAKQIITALIG